MTEEARWILAIMSIPVGALLLALLMDIIDWVNEDTDGENLGN